MVSYLLVWNESASSSGSERTADEIYCADDCQSRVFRVKIHYVSDEILLLEVARIENAMAKTL